MAKLNRSMTFEKAQINVQDGTITEYLKDETNIYKVQDVLKEWDMIDGISITFKQTDSISSQEMDKEGET